MSVSEEQDVVLVRQCTKEIASLAGLSAQDQTRLVTAVSEIVRNAFQYAGSARVEIAIDDRADQQYVLVVVCDQGPGIVNTEEILSGSSKAKTGRGILAARRLVDRFSIESTPETGTSVSLGKEIPVTTGLITRSMVDGWMERLPKAPGNLLKEIQDQHKQLLQTLADTQNYKLELERQLQHVQQLNNELERTNKGIFALYKELDDSKIDLVHKTELLEQQRQQLQETTRHKSEFLANMSHEIRTPMNGVLGMTEVLLKSGLTEKQREYANTIRQAGKALLTVINEVLDFSKIEAGKLTLELIEFEPVRLVEDIAELLAGQAKQNGLTLLTFIDPEIPLILRGDPVRIRQILMNFVSNAIKFSEHGSIVIRTVLESKSSNTIRFSVTDPGVGLAEHELNLLFEPFVQSESSTARKYGGTGLGLSISKRLVELMGGTLGVNSVKGHGSTFWFSVPLEVSSSQSVKDLAPAHLAGLKVLIVDDDRSACEIFHTYVLSWGLRNGVATNVEEALDLLRNAAKSDPYDLAIIDLVMPNMSGLQLGKIIKEDDSLKGMKTILITAFDKPGAGEEAILLGFDAYLTKPARQSQLLNVIAALIFESRNDERQNEHKDEGIILTSAENQLKRRELILLAEDHPVNQQVGIWFLKELGFEAHVAESGREILEIIKHTPYSLILMDCEMPEMDGFEATRRIRKMETRSGKHIPIVAMTAHAIEGSREQCLAAGMDDYISKPIDPDQLKFIMNKWLPLNEDLSSINHNTSQSISILDVKSHFNLEELKARVGEEGAIKLLKLFQYHAPVDLRDIALAIKQCDTAQISHTAHKLNGSLTSLCSEQLPALMIKLEDAAIQRDWHEVHLLFKTLEKSFAQLEQLIDQILESIGAKSSEA